jgi:hypothetical protein
MVVVLAPNLIFFTQVVMGFEMRLRKHLKVPKCEIFDQFFYTNKSYMGR